MDDMCGIGLDFGGKKGKGKVSGGDLEVLIPINDTYYKVTTSSCMFAVVT